MILARGVARVAEAVRLTADEALKDYPLVGADGQVQRVARRSAIIGAVGELAIESGLLPWPKNDAIVAATRWFTEWLVRRGSSGPLELKRGVEQVKRFFEANGDSRFGDIGGNEKCRVIDRVEFRRQLENGNVEFLVLPESFRTVLCNGFDPVLLGKELIRLGFLIPSEKHSSTTVKIPALGLNSSRVYRFSSRILGS